jgi:tellurite resistance protein TehA-like permease
MKTTKFFTPLSLTFIILASSFVFAPTTAKSEIPIPSPKTKQTVTFVVTITNTGNPWNYPGIYYIKITDDRGIPVAQPQEFHPGIWSYTFTEFGTTFSGTRTAQIYNVIQSQGVRGGSYIIPPVTLPGPFKAGNTYSFMLLPH